MYKVIIIGGGFGGLFALERFSRYIKKGLDVDITLIDKKPTFDFLPLLPDIIGRRINPEYLIYRIGDLREKFRFKFVVNEVISVDLNNKKVLGRSQSFNYDYLIIASGSETNFYGNDYLSKQVYKIDYVSDLQKIAKGLEGTDFDYYLIVGGGYTGIETATNLRVCLNKKSKNKRIIIIEKKSSILSFLDERIRTCVAHNCKRLDIEIFSNTQLAKVEERRAYLSDGSVFNNALLIWTAGVRTADFIQDLKVEKDYQGRIKVDEYLRLTENCFVIGDSAYVLYNNIPLRMAVRFAIEQGIFASDNIIRSICKMKPKKYKPLDLGYIIPMANNKSCGVVLGMRANGMVPTLLHYMMCVYRSRGVKNKLGMIKDLIRGGGVR